MRAVRGAERACLQCRPCRLFIRHPEKKQAAGGQADSKNVQQQGQQQQQRQLLHVPAWDEAQEAGQLLQQLQLAA